MKYFSSESKITIFHTVIVKVDISIFDSINKNKRSNGSTNIFFSFQWYLPEIVGSGVFDIFVAKITFFLFCKNQ